MQLVHVPLVIIHPRLVPRGIRVQEPVTLRNLAATTLDLANLDDDGLIPGRSLATFWEPGDSIQSSAQPILLSLTPPVRTAEESRNAVGEVRSLVLGRLHYIRNPEGTEELFDVQEDPRQRRNLMKSGEFIPELGALRRRMREIDSRIPREIPFLSKRDLAHM
jgi:arylsulfatase A-like enzyme